ncbi:MAG: helix-turn-helix transcriptional regulator [Nitrococcus mobilis]|nr:helix-turn-helix transcriptional regulator [Nitrococcus mobilis]
MTAEALRAARQALGLTQKQMAEALGLHWRHYQRLEAGTHKITKRTALACAALSGAPVTPARSR